MRDVEHAFGDKDSFFISSPPLRPVLSPASADLSSETRGDNISACTNKLALTQTTQTKRVRH